MPKSSKPVVEKHSLPSKGNRSEITQVGQTVVTNRAKTEEQKIEELNAPRSSIFKTANGENHEIKGDLFDNQILEIDIELNKFGSLGSEIRGETANQKEVGSDFPNGDKDEKKKKLSLKVHPRQVLVMWPT